MKKVINEGSWFAVPLKGGGFAVGLVTRSSAGGGVVLAYFFDSLHDEIPRLEDVEAYAPRDAVRILRIGDLAFLNKEWPIIGASKNWDRATWVVPEFVRRDELSQRAWKVIYSNDDPNLVASEEPTAYDSPLPRDALFGAGAVVTMLSSLIRKRPA